MGLASVRDSKSVCVTSSACAGDLFPCTARLRSDALDSSAHLFWGAKQVACWSSFFKCNTQSKICDQIAHLWFPCLVTVSPPEPGTMAKRVIHSKATLTAQRTERDRLTEAGVSEESAENWESWVLPTVSP